MVLTGTAQLGPARLTDCSASESDSAGLVACSREPFPLLLTRQRPGPQVGAHPHRPRPVPASDRLQMSPHRGEEGCRFPETAPAECAHATKRDAAAGGGPAAGAPGHLEPWVTAI